MTATSMLTRLERLFAERGAEEYHGEAVSQLEHALQSAALAEADGCSPATIVAALLHDIGHMLHGHGENCAEAGTDDRHEELGVRFLRKAFGPEVTEPVRLHVAAKRYLSTGIHPAYPALLSPASVRSLALQGGPMSSEEVAAFERNPHSAEAARIRVFDDRAKVAGLATPPFTHFRRYLDAVIQIDDA